MIPSAVMKTALLFPLAMLTLLHTAAFAERIPAKSEWIVVPDAVNTKERILKRSSAIATATIQPTILYRLDDPIIDSLTGKEIVPKNHDLVSITANNSTVYCTTKSYSILNSGLGSFFLRRDDEFVCLTDPDMDFKTNEYFISSTRNLTSVPIFRSIKLEGFKSANTSSFHQIDPKESDFKLPLTLRYHRRNKEKGNYYFILTIGPDLEGLVVTDGLTVKIFNNPSGVMLLGSRFVLKFDALEGVYVNTITAISPYILTINGAVARFSPI